MRVQYPYYSNWIKVSRVVETDRFDVCNRVTGSHTKATKKEVEVARKLDGKTSPNIIFKDCSDEEIELYLDSLKMKSLIRSDHGFSAFKKMRLFKALYLSGISPGISKKICCVYNKMLMILCIPVLAVALSCLIVNPPGMVYTDWMAVAGTIIGVTTGAIIHELSHTMSGIAYGADVYEFGFQILPVFGGYTFMDTEGLKNDLHILQINAAGVESNFLIAGFFVILADSLGRAGMISFCAGYANILIGFINLFPVNELDGARILRNLICIHRKESV